MFLNIKYAYYGLVKKIPNTLSAIIQFSICFTFLYFIINQNTNISNEANRITSIFNGRDIYSVKMYDNFNTYSDNEKVNKFKILSESLKTNPKITHVGYEDEEIHVQNFNGIDNFLASMSNLGDRKDYSWIRSIKVDDKFMRNFKFEINQGRPFRIEDFNKRPNEATPVILGQNYKQKFKVNDEIKYKNRYGGDIRNLKVVGFLKSNYYFVGSSNTNFEPINLDSYVIFPKQSVENTMSLKEDNAEFNMMKDVLKLQNLKNSLIIINPDFKNDKDKIITEITKEVENLGLQNEIEFKDLTNKNNALVNSFNSAVKEHKIIVYMAIVFTSIGMICTSLNNIRKRDKEFGVHISCGCTKNDIAKRIFYEVSLVTAISLIISCILIVLISRSFRTINEPIISWIPLIKLISFSVILSIVISIPPVLKILKKEPENLIKR